jgi:sugar lactone lactonase YvrE
MIKIYLRLFVNQSTHHLKQIVNTGLLFISVVIAISQPFKSFAQAPVLSYPGPQTYAAGTTIAPLAPTSSGVAAPGYRGVSVNIGSGFSGPQGVAVDAAGNVYVADTQNNSVKEIPVGGGAPVVLGSGFNQPQGVAVDAAGNVYVADYGNNAVKEIPVGGGAIITLVNDAAAGFYAPVAIAVDAFGNVYVSDNYEAFKVPAGGGVPVNIGNFAVGYSYPSEGLAVDAAGNVYVTNAYGVAKIPIVGGQWFELSQFNVSASDNATGVAVDGSGNVYAAIAGNPTNGVQELLACGAAPVSIGSGFSSPFGIALDGAGNVYVADDGDNNVKEITPNGGYYITGVLPAGLSFNNTTGVISGTPTVSIPATNYTITAWNSSGHTSATVTITVNLPPIPAIGYSSPQTYTQGTAISTLVPTGSGVASPGYNQTPVTLASGFNYLESIAVDAAGNVYVADINNGVVDKIPAGGGATVSLGSFAGARGVAVDPSGNIYVGNNTTVQEIKASDGTIVTLCPGFAFSNAAGIALDPAGDIYVICLSMNGSTVYMIPAGSSNPVVVGALTNSVGLAIDAAGNIYSVVLGGTSVQEFPVSGANPVTVGSGFLSTTGVAVDAAGNVYVSDDYNEIWRVPVGGSPVPLGGGFDNPQDVAVDAIGNVYVADSHNNAVKEIKLNGGYYINPALPAGLNFNNSTGFISGTPAVSSPATNYTVTAYNPAGLKSATVNITVNPLPVPTISYASPQTYTLNKAISALKPASAGVAAAAYSINPVYLGSGFSNPTDVAVDASGNVYIADQLNNAVKKIPAGGGAPVILGSGFNEPTAVAVDAAGNVYVADQYNNAIKKIPASGASAPVTLGSGFSYPTGVAVDAAGNVYVADNGNGLVKKIPAGGGVPVAIGSGFEYPNRVAVDVAGNVYVSDGGLLAIVEIPAAGGVPVTISSGAGNPEGITVDAEGDVFYADAVNNTLNEIPFGGGAQVTIGSGYSTTSGVTIDGAGNLYIADSGNNLVRKLPPVGGYYLNTPLPAGLQFNMSTGVISGTPTTVSPATNYTVTAYNLGGGTAAALSIKVVPSSNANLSRLVISSGTLTPAFAAANTSYTASVNYAVTSITVTPVTSDSSATVKVNGITVKSGSASASLPLNVGPNTITTVVTAQDGTTTVTYTVIVTRTVNANLASLTTSDGALTPVFSADSTSYAISVSNSTTSIAITPVTSDPAATVKVNGTTVTSGSASASLPLNVGPNTLTTVVTAADGVTTLTYTIIVTRAPSANASLAGLSISAGTLSPAFATGATAYTAQVNNSTTSITITPTTSDATASVKVNGTTVASGSASASLPLLVGSNTITVSVTAQDGVTTQTYTVVITRAPSSIANLSNLTVSSGALTPVFAAATTSYTASVGNAVSSVTITPTLQDTTATLTVNGVSAVSGTATAAIPVSVGDNNISIVVTAQDGKTTKTYTLDVQRLGSSNVSLANLTISSGVLSPVFSPTTGSYTDDVANNVTSVEVTPTLSDITASVTVNNMQVQSGSASAAIPLSVGSNEIIITVYSSGYLYSNTDTITVIRSLSSNANLSSLAISTGSLSPAFVSGTLSYTASLPTSDSTISITPTVSDLTATVTVNGVAVKSGVASAPITLNPGSNAITVIVTAQNGSNQTYTVIVTRALPTIFTLPDTNFKLTITGATCDGSANGSVAIKAAQALNYTATVSGNGVNTPYSFADTLTIGSLPAGSYNVCLTVAGQPQYQQCYDVVISQPQALSVYAAVNSTTNSLDLNLSGGNTYSIRLNGVNYTTTNSTYSLPLQAGQNNLEVTTDRLCQGTFTRSFNILSAIVPFPDPFQSTLSVNLGTATLNNATVQVYNLSYSKLFYSKQYGTMSGTVQFDLSALTKGVYALKITSGNTENIFKIIKQ